jgi:GNAT superfamily N-acetyltransferase
MAKFQIRALGATDKEWAVAILIKWWEGPQIMTRGKLHDVDKYPGFIAVKGKKRVGLVTYHFSGPECEITSMNSLVEGKGIGRALVDEVKKTAAANGCKRLFLITTNDNLHALKFWQKYGFSLIAVYPNAVAECRKLKPGIPLTGNDDIPLRDEIELEMVL